MGPSSHPSQGAAARSIQPCRRPKPRARHCSALPSAARIFHVARGAGTIPITDGPLPAPTRERSRTAMTGAPADTAEGTISHNRRLFTPSGMAPRTIACNSGKGIAGGFIFPPGGRTGPGPDRHMRRHHVVTQRRSSLIPSPTAAGRPIAATVERRGEALPCDAVDKRAL